MIETLYRRYERWQEPFSEPLKTKLRQCFTLLWRIRLKTKYWMIAEEITGYATSEYQKKWYDVLQDRRNKTIVVAAPRGHIKTTCFSVNYPLIRIAEDHNVRILLVSNAESQSQAFLREIKSKIERSEEYVEFAGQLKPHKAKKWSAREIIIERDNVNLKDPTISTVGVGGTILSKRVDEIVCDDILNPENTRTYEQRKKLKEWFYQVLLPILAPGGRLIFVGTVWHPQDLLNEMLAEAAFDYRDKMKAIISEPVHMELWDEWYRIRLTSRDDADRFFTSHYTAMHEGVEVLWRENFTYATLYLIRRMNRAAFEKSYQNNIVSTEDQKFKDEWLEKAKERGRNQRLIRFLGNDIRREFSVLTSGIDSAASESEQADDNAMASLGLRRLDEMVQLLSLDRGKFTPKEWRQTISDRNDGLRPDRIIVESNGYQVALKRDLAEKNIPVVAFHTGGEKLDPYIGVESLAILFENDRIILPYDKSDPYTIAMVDQLVDELRQFPVGHTGDSAMALWFAFTAMRDIMSKTVQKHGMLATMEADKRMMDGKPKVGGLPAWMEMARSTGQML